MKYKSPSYENCDSTKEVLDIMIERIKSKPEAEWTIALGTDSQNKRSKTKFCSAILILEKGKGGTFFYSTELRDRIKVRQTRMLEEAKVSIDLGKEMLAILEDAFVKGIFDYTEHKVKLEIHCDLGLKGKSKDSVKAAIGWITSEFGDVFEAKVKPDSCAASHIADIYTK